MKTTEFDTSKLAVVYLRQSTPGQVRDNVIATGEQYRLREIPERLGFPPERIVVVDEDLGVSGQTIAGRKGMLRILDLLERGAASCVVVRDISRLTRDEFNADIGLIVRQCYHAGAKIVTPEKTYDPSDPSDQLLLGLQGLLAGWDRSQIMRRLDHHRRAKQARGVNINGAVPPGYEKIADVPKSHPDHGRLRVTSDPEARERVALILRKGLELKGILAVVRFLRQHQLRIPVIRGEEQRQVIGTDGRTRLIGAGRRVVEWVEATRDGVTRILKNPTYTGAVVNGRRARERDPATGRARWTTRRPYDRCIVIRNAHPTYITWEEHLALLAAIARNNQAKTYGQGQALLSGLGLLRCGPCGAAMVVQYHNPRRGTPYDYVCTRRDADGRLRLCQNPAGSHIDRAVTDLVLFALGELDLGGLREVMENRERRAHEAARLRAQRVEALARQAQTVEAAIGDATLPEARTRLVALYEKKLAELEAARADAAQPVEPPAPAISPGTLARLEVLREPAAAWAWFTQKTRKEIIRALATAVLVYPDLDGYIVVADWAAGGRAAAKATTVRRRKLYTIPEEVLALFGGELGRNAQGGALGSGFVHSREASRLGTGRPDGRG